MYAVMGTTRHVTSSMHPSPTQFALKIEREPTQRTVEAECSLLMKLQDKCKTAVRVYDYGEHPAAGKPSTSCLAAAAVRDGSC